jgi:hypothetical protein
MKLEIKPGTKEARLFSRLEKVFQTKNPTDALRMVIEKAYETVRNEELAKVGAAQSKMDFDPFMHQAQGLDNV